ncbi:unnamed protein product [Gadus morhua 'NCC']
MNPPGGARSQIQAGVEYESAQNHTVPDVTQPRVRAAADARLPVPSAQIRAAESFTRPCSLHRGGRSQRASRGVSALREVVTRTHGVSACCVMFGL